MEINQDCIHQYPNYFACVDGYKKTKANFLLWPLVWFLGIILFLGLSAKSYAQSAEQGKKLFQQKGCVGCHSLGTNKMVGPGLKGVTKRKGRTKKWIVRFIIEPGKVIKENDPIAKKLLQEFKIPMVSMGLSKKEAESIYAFLKSQDSSAEISSETSAKEESIAEDTSTQAAAKKIDLSTGDPKNGQKLFTGEVALENGGTQCLACHSVKGVGSLGGGTLGPDLTETATADRFGAGEGLIATLRTLPFPNMRVVFEKKPLTEAEIKDLGAFFVSVSARKRSDFNWDIVLYGTGGFFILLLLPLVFWSGRLKGVRKIQIENAQAHIRRK